MSKVFVSYKRVDKDKVFSIVRQLESELGIRFWIDLNGIESDEQFASAILKAINQCEVLLFMYSKAHHKITDFERDWTVREINYADEKRKRIVFIDIESVNLPDWFILKFPLKQVIQAEDAQAMERLKKDMCKWLQIQHPQKNSLQPSLSADSAKNMKVFAVDLGLPSGTKWASCNIGANSPEEYGSFFAWGETEEKSEYSRETYSHCDGKENTCHNLGKDICETKYDVAHVRWGGKWHMPTCDQIDELIINCFYEWVTINGIKGGKFTGSNGNSIFLPSAGFCEGYELIANNEGGYYWTGTQNKRNWDGAYCLSFCSDYPYWHDDWFYERYQGYNVRPVINP